MTTAKHAQIGDPLIPRVVARLRAMRAGTESERVSRGGSRRKEGGRTDRAKARVVSNC